MNADYTVVVTRPDGESFVERLRSCGFSLVEVPLFSVVAYYADRQPGALAELVAASDWLIFTSRNGVRFFKDQYRQQLPATIRCAAIGARTAHCFREQFARGIDYQGEGSSSESFAPGFFSNVAQGQRVLLATAREHHQAIPNHAKALGLQIETVALYQREPCEIPLRVFDQLSSLDASKLIWPFFSPSAFQACLTIDPSLAPLLHAGQLLSIGETTSCSIREHGFTVAAQSESPSEESMCSAICELTS